MDVARGLPRCVGVLSDMVVPWNLEHQHIFSCSGSSRTIASSHNLLLDLALLIIRPKGYIHAGQISDRDTAAPGFDRRQEMLLDNSSFRLGHGFQAVMMYPETSVRSSVLRFCRRRRTKPNATNRSSIF
jgi:hypothetical protein